MEKYRVGMAFSRQFRGSSPLGHIGVKLPVYIRLLTLCEAKGWEVYVLTKKTYKGNGIFEGSWRYLDGKFEKIKTPVKIDLVYDRCAGIKFPSEGDDSLIWINRRDFKILCWDKWKAYRQIGKFMPKTFWVERQEDLPAVLAKVKTEWVSLKPFNGLKGLGVFIGPKYKAQEFKFSKKFKHYIAQEFVDTSGGVPKITKGFHDIRVAVTNQKAVWSHVRVPLKGSYLANAAAGGILTEVDYTLLPRSIKKIVEEIAEKFSQKYDDPSYSIDFGVGKDGTPKIFEINDQIGFPRWEMKNRDKFLKALVDNFESKLNGKNRAKFL
ncbi:hypothetical protein A2985_00660 [Candidatus Woesebacteria bacterium RIFCSPLOWO2_01_FULL_43_11]|uniref:ATP-grasp domain-containing protein n=1 Tax=Candidatus Woesebacteria bacterium RBG_16_42_24 TaxID=1802485 RepID=A0A1F7XJU1_9BACT|nr:MAG: hypothetical protein A2V97_01350 [Candidatus Woesebacteria bacterium RBG_16_42_24]OGM67653.1 MAG: hypothetical protein A2985_00660 [Candidatus Woesebacteria bacterium RIFCSPLOWO2_01_FULL_43_11]